MTKKARRKEQAEVEQIVNPRYVPKQGVDHVLDDADVDEERDKRDGSIRKGISGIFDIRRLGHIHELEEEVDWHVANPDRPGSSSPMNQPITAEDACRRAKLTDLQREAMLRYLDGDSIALIAEEMGISEAAVQMRLNWGRLKLKVAFGEEALDIRAQ